MISYSETNYLLLGPLQIIFTLDRLFLLKRDMLYFFRAGQVDQLLALKMTSYLSVETDYLPWDAANDLFRYVDDMLSRTPTYGDFQTYVHHRVLPLYQKVGWSEKPGEAHLDK